MRPSRSGNSGKASAPAPIPDATVTGQISPDATGDYFLTGTRSGGPIYTSNDGVWNIYFNPQVGKYILERVAGQGAHPEWWKNEYSGANGTYDPQNYATGNAIIVVR